MAKRLWDKTAAGTEIKLWVDPEIYVKIDDEAERDRLQVILDASDALRQELVDCGGYPDLQSFDDFIQDQQDDIKDRIDIYDYDTADTIINTHVGSWFSPISVEDFGGEDVGFEAINTIDGVNNTQWRHEATHTHFMTWQIRSYSKKMSKMRIRYGASEAPREQLVDITIKGTNNLNNIDDASNIIATGINPTYPVAAGAVWVEIDFGTKVTKKFMKIEFDTQDVNDRARIREIEFWVEPRDPS